MLSFRLPLLATLLIAVSLPAYPVQEKQADSTSEIAKVEKTYDADKDQTIVRFSGWPIAELKDEKILMDAEGWYLGRTATQPVNEIKLKITSISSSGYKYENPITLTITLGTYRFQPWSFTELGRNLVNGEYVQTMEATVDFPSFYTVAQTNNVKVELNQTQMLLLVPRLKRLLEFGRHMTGAKVAANESGIISFPVFSIPQPRSGIR